MPNYTESFEQVDLSGSTGHFNGSVGSTLTSIPGFADKNVSEVFIQNVSVPANRVLLVSFDGGSNFISVGRNSHLAWTPKGYLSQIKIKSQSSLSVDYEILVNFEEY